MPYDKDSFLAGLAAGRASWFPPFPLPQGDVHDWTADEEWLITDPGIVASAIDSIRTPYIKINYGKTVAAYFENGTVSGYGNNWCGIYFFSTMQDAVRLYYNSEQGWYYSKIHSFTYLGLTWYVCYAGQNSQYGGATSLITDLPTFDATGYIVGYPSWDARPNMTTVYAMLEAANVRLI